MQLFKRKKISNYLLLFLFSFSIFSQENNTLDFLDKVENQKFSKESLTEEKTTQKKKINKGSPKTKTKSYSKRIKKRVRPKKNKNQSNIIWINDNIFFEPKLKDFDLIIEDDNPPVKPQEPKFINEKELVQSISSTSKPLTVKQKMAQQEIFHFSQYIFSIMIEYKKAIIILVLILLLAFFRSRYLKKSSNSMKVSKETIILNSKRKY